MSSYEFAYFGRGLGALNDIIASWCSGRGCLLETTSLLQGGIRFRISGPDDTIREAIRTVRVWIRSAA